MEVEKLPETTNLGKTAKPSHNVGSAPSDGSEHSSEVRIPINLKFIFMCLFLHFNFHFS
jgi:hypothetical protein